MVVVGVGGVAVGGWGCGMGGAWNGNNGAHTNKKQWKVITSRLLGSLQKASGGHVMPKE